MFKEVLDFEEIIQKIKDYLKEKKNRQKAILFILLIAIIFIAKDKLFNKEIVLENNEEVEQIPNAYGETINNSDSIFIDISGEVNVPGVYEVKIGTRLYEVIELAGGLTEYANVDSLNRAETVLDGQKIIVSKKGEESSESYLSQNSGIVNGKVSINNGSLEDLLSLPGIGNTKAQRIIEYRNSNGKFKDISEIKNVSGIGDATFESIKDLICL